MRLALARAPPRLPSSFSSTRIGPLGREHTGPPHRHPNGRRLTDDVTDIDLQVVAGALKGNKVPLGDGVDQNDVPFLTKFPYVAPPNAGANPDAAYGSRIKALAQQGGDVFPSFSGSDSSSSNGSDDDGGTSAIVWVLIAAGAVVLIGIAFAAGRGQKGSA
jgi:hypothetical protein